MKLLAAADKGSDLDCGQPGASGQLAPAGTSAGCQRLP